MNKKFGLSLILIPFLLCGCVVEGYEIAQATEGCKSHGGVDSLDIGIVVFTRCNDGTIFNATEVAKPGAPHG
jgi:hypothetical protein